MEEDKVVKKQKQRLKSKVSFSSLKNIGRENDSGLFSRPNAPINYDMHDPQTHEKLFALMSSYLPKTIEDIQKSIVKHVEYTLARTRFDFKQTHCYQAVAHSVRDRLIESFNDTYREFNRSKAKIVYYISLEFLIGRCLQNALINLDLQENYREALAGLGFRLENIYEREVDAALGNGGLGRLAACFLDSLATLNYPAWGYGIRYNYGIFKQRIEKGFQVEVPDFWLSNGNPWEIQRIDVEYKINFYGNTRKSNFNGHERVYWENCQTIIARAYDTPIPGYATFNTIGLRLWKSLPLNEFDFNSFNSGEYYKALEARQRAQYITSVLYPNDSTDQGKQLRLKQQYLLVSATLQDIIRRHKSKAKRNLIEFEWVNFPNQAAIQLNDTHPALAIVQLLRILLDEQGLKHESAWQIVSRTFSYTNHTVLPQALQKWSVDLLNKLLPRHLQLIYLINHFWMYKVKKLHPNDQTLLNTLSLVEQSQPKRIRMANLCMIASHQVNGVAAIHTQLLKTTLFKEFHNFFPGKIINITNGVTARRWVMGANPKLAELYTKYLATDQWVLSMDKLIQLEPCVQNESFLKEWNQVKLDNKKKLAWWVKDNFGIRIDVDSMFDIHIKRIHQYKRQFMNILYVVHRYLTLKAMTVEERNNAVSRTVMFAGKAAPAYTTAKNIIKFINTISDTVNQDPSTNMRLKVLFLPNYNVSNAQIIIPACDLSQHISTAGTQASGTSNMKFVMNGGLIIGTLDGANVEIAEAVGLENIFIFGAKVEQIEELKKKMRVSADYIPVSLRRVIEALQSGMFGEKELMGQLINTISNNNDAYLVSADFDSYIKEQENADKVFQDRRKWTRMSIQNAIRSGKFSSDRTISQYAQNVWNVTPVPVTLQ